LRPTRTRQRLRSRLRAVRWADPCHRWL
jgi:hypothetical protein